MYNITEYIKWRGHDSFKESSFNVVDNLIFTQLSYLDFADIVPSDIKKGVLLKDVWSKYVALGRKPEGAILPKEIFDMFRAMAKSKRFSNVKLSGYVSKYDEAEEKQFAALTISFGRSVYVAFRGTDDTLIGWKEDFNLAFMESIPAQKEAAYYLNEVMRKIFFKKVYVGGHSKGGNLSVYGAMHLKKRYKNRIKNIFTNDGPGFLEKAIKSEEYLDIMDKIISIVPEGSVVGQLLYQGKPDDIIIKNSYPTLMQHNPFTWEVSGTGFLKAESLNEQSGKIKSIVTSWLESNSEKERESFVESMYELMKVNDAKCLKDIFSDKIGFLMALKNLSKDSKKDIGKNIGQIIGEIAKNKGKNK